MARPYDPYDRGDNPWRSDFGVPRMDMPRSQPTAKPGAGRTAAPAKPKKKTKPAERYAGTRNGRGDTPLPPIRPSELSPAAQPSEGPFPPSTATPWTDPPEGLLAPTPRMYQDTPFDPGPPPPDSQSTTFPTPRPVPGGGPADPGMVGPITRADQGSPFDPGPPNSTPTPDVPPYAQGLTALLHRLGIMR